MKKSSARHSGNPNFPTLLSDAGITASELARRIDVFPSTVSTWTTGKTTPPGAVIAYLELLAKVRAIHA
jgi:DNA-binding transcriptional regulator YiaG